jgi:hypothetical protein
MRAVGREIMAILEGQCGAMYISKIIRLSETGFSNLLFVTIRALRPI